MQNYLRSFIISVASLAVTTIGPAIPAQAAALTWTLRDAVFEDGGTLTGTFDYDAETYLYSNVNITVSSGGILDAFGYQTSSSCAQTFTPGTCIQERGWYAPDQFLVDVLAEGYGTDTVGTYNPGLGHKGFLFLAFESALTSAGGVVPLDNSGELWYRPQVGDTHRAGMREVVRGEVVSQSAAAVPEPTTMAGLALAGTGLAYVRRRKAAMKAAIDDRA